MRSAENFFTTGIDAVSAIGKRHSTRFHHSRLPKLSAPQMRKYKNMLA